MEIQLVYEDMIKALPFEERGMAIDISESFRYDSGIRSAWLRKPSLVLGDALDLIIKKAADVKQRPRRISLYCDTLLISEKTSIPIIHDDGVQITVYARQVVPKTTGGAAVNMQMNDGATFFLFATNVPPTFVIDVEISPKGTRQSLAFVPSKQFGISASYDDGEILMEDQEGPDAEMIASNYLQQLTDDGRLNEDAWINDNLPRLVQFQFLCATAEVRRNNRLALELLNFVCKATNTRSSYDYNFEATGLRSSILAQIEDSVSFVPSVDIVSCRLVLQARLQAAQAFEDSFKLFNAQKSDAEYLDISGDNLLNASMDAMDEFDFLEGQARENYNSASTAYDKANKTFTTRQEELKKASDDFQAGVQAYKKAEMASAAKDIVLSFIGVIAAVGATVATAGAAGPLVAMAAKNAISTASKVAKIWEKIKAIIERLKAIKEKFGPMFEKLAKLAAAMKNMIDIIATSKQIAQRPTELETASTQQDPINGAATWDAFSIDVEMMFSELKDYPIDGKPKYEGTLRKLAPAGKAVLSCQAAVITSGQILATILLRKRHQNRHQGRLEKSLEHIKQSSDLLSIFKRAMFDRVLAIRGMVFLDIWSYVTAFQYYALTTDVPFHISAMKPIGDFKADAARLEAVVATFGATTMIQQKTFIVTVPASDPTLSNIQRDGQAVFHPSLEAAMFAKFSRLRLKRVRCYLDGLSSQSPDNSTIQIKLSTDGRFFDRDLPRKISSVGSDSSQEEEIIGRGLPVAFVGDKRSTLFEYDLKTGTIICDGDCGLKDDYTKHTPFTEWIIDVREAGKVNDDLIWEDFKAARFEFLCEFTLSGN